MGNGPSLNQMDLGLLAGESVWGANRCYLLFERIDWRPAFYVSVDKRVVPDIAQEIAALFRELTQTLFFFPVEFRERGLLPSAPNVYWYREVDIDETDLPDGTFSRDAAQFVTTVRTVTVAAMQLAAFLGFNPIYLIGCDTSYSIPSTARSEGDSGEKLVSTEDDDPNHFDPSYFGKGRKWHNPHVERMIFHYEQARKVCDAMGVEVYNATVGGKLEVFPRVDYRTLF